MKVGFIGLGAMGHEIVPRLIAGGHEVVGWNRSRDKAAALIDQGMRWAGTAREAAASAEVVLSIVTDAKAVEAVTLGDDGILAGMNPGAVYADMSTISPDASRRIAGIFADAGSVMLDAPLSGSPVTLRESKASIMVGGDEAAFKKASPVFLSIGPKLTHIGENGLAVQMKIAINLSLMVQVIAFGEAIALAEKGGVQRDVAVDAMLKSVAASPVLGYRGPFILEGNMPDVPLADVNLQQKDMILALDLARRQGSVVPLAAAANEIMNACRGLGIDHRDFVTAFDVYRKLGGDNR